MDKPKKTKRKAPVPKPVKSFEFTNVQQGKAYELEPVVHKRTFAEYVIDVSWAKIKPLLSRKTLTIIGVILVVIGVSVGGYVLLNQKPQKSAIASTLSPEISSQLTIPIYLVQSLPKGYAVNNDFKIIHPNVLNFSITSPDGHKYSISEQLIPQNFDFVTFNKKFLSPDTYSTGVGTVTAGLIGSNIVGSIRTNNNSWILINAPSSGNSSLTDLEAITRAFYLAR